MKSPFRWVYPFDYPLIVYCLIYLWVAHRVGLGIEWGILLDFTIEQRLFLAFGPCLVVMLLIEYMRRRFDLNQEVATIFREMKKVCLVYAQPWRDWRRWYEFFRITLALKMCMTVYSHFKQSIPLLSPHRFDDELWVIDRWVHLGLSPVHATLRLFSHDVLAWMIDRSYVFWYPLLTPFLIYFMVVARRLQRWHFFTCYLLLWMIAGGFAIAVPSWGPCYTNPELYAQLKTPCARYLQEMLWEHYNEMLAAPERYSVLNYEGIAAFPSLHVGIVVLFTLVVRHNRHVFWWMVVYTACVQLGSVFLGWHYAVDGYFAGILAWAIYYATRPWFRDQQDEATPHPPPALPHA